MGVLNKTINSSKWLALEQVSSKLLSVISFVLLARLLDPNAYGLIAIVLTMVGFFNRMFVSGFESALVQMKGESGKYLNSVWTFGFLKSFLFALIIYLIAPAVVIFFHVPELLNYVRWSGLFIIVPSLINIKHLYLFKDFHFNKLYVRDLAGQIAYVIVALVWAGFIRADISALFVANLARYIAPLFVIYYYYPSWPRFELNFARLKELFPYSKWITGQNFVRYLTSIIDTVLIARLLNPVMLGFYTKGKNLGFILTSVLTGFMKNLGFVAFSKIQDSPDKIKQGFMMSLDLIFIFSWPAIIGAWLWGEALVRVFLGDKWLNILPALQIFSVSAVSSAVIFIAYQLFNGVGKPSINFKIKVISVIFYALFVTGGIYYKSMVGAALGVALSDFLIMLYVFYKLKRVYQLSYISVLASGLSSLIPLLVSLIFVWPAALIWDLGQFAMLGLLVVYGLLAAACFWWFGKKFQTSSWQTVNMLFKSYLGRFFSKTMEP